MSRSISLKSIRFVVSIAVLAIVSAWSLSAMAQDRQHPGRGEAAHAMPVGWGGGPMGGGHGMMAGRGIERLLDRVNATPEQRAQIKAITEAAHADLKKHRESGRALREQAMKAFTATNVDANAVEAARAQMMQHHDQASRRMAQAMLDVSRVLTPEQRKQLADLMARRGEMMKRHMQERQQLDGGRRS